jgi:hypothetical protein
MEYCGDNAWQRLCLPILASEFKHSGEAAKAIYINQRYIENQLTKKNLCLRFSIVFEILAIKCPKPAISR